MIMGKKVWAVVCGAVRQEFELYTTIAMLCDYRSRGFIEGIVISTWKGELENIKNLRSKLELLNIYVVELDPLNEELGKFLHLSYARQAYQLKSALELVPNDVFVLKCRTDCSENRIKLFDDVIQGKVDLTAEKFGGFDSGLNYKIAVDILGVGIPFVFCDIVFLGHVSDIKKMADIKAVVTEYGFLMGPDYWFFISAFIKTFPLLEQFLMTLRTYAFFPGGIFQNKLKQYIIENKDAKETFALPGIFNKFYALYFLIIHCGIYSVSCKKIKISKLYLSDIFACNNDVGMKLGWSTFIANTEILRMLINFECEPTKGYIKLFKEICNLAVPGCAQKIYFTKEDHDETCEWLKNVLKEEPNKWLRYKHLSTAKQNDFDFSDTISILYSENKISDMNEMCELLQFICFNENDDYYNSILYNLPQIKKFGDHFYETALSASSRTENPEVLKNLAKRLFYNEMGNKKTDLSQIFERFEWHPTYFYSFPMPSSKIAAFYYYGKYAESMGNYTLSKNFYNQIIHHFNISDSNPPENYADAVLEIIKAIVLEHYKEYKNDRTIKYMIDFLTDEFFDTAFTLEQLNYLSEYILERKYAVPFRKGEPSAFDDLIMSKDKECLPDEADKITLLILREKWNQPHEIQEKADEALIPLAQKCNSNILYLVKINFLNNGEIIPFDLPAIAGNDEYILLLKILSEKKSLLNNKESVQKICNSDSFRIIALELFCQLEQNDNIKLFSSKNGTEFWISYIPFAENKINVKLMPVKDSEHLTWPYSDCASPSALAAFFKFNQNDLFFSVEFSSYNSPAKQLLFENIDKTAVDPFEPKANIIRLKSLGCPLEHLQNPYLYSAYIENALKCFCGIGDMLTQTAIKITKTICNDVPD